MDILSDKHSTEQDGSPAGLPSAHSLSVADAADRLAVNTAEGLSEGEARKRLALFGPNTIEAGPGRRWWMMLAGQFNSIVVWLLAFASAVSWLTDSPLEAAAILAVLLINALIGFAIEWQAGRALDSLKRRSRQKARVLRGGKTKEIDAANLAPGDVVLLTAGNRVPADARLIETFNLEADESALTGESLPVVKTVDPVADRTLLAERKSMVYLGTTIGAGHGKAIVTATGLDTELGAVGRMISQAETDRTPLEKRLARVGEKLVYVVLFIAAVVMLAGYLRGDGVWLMLEVSISLAVAAVPEGLPAVTTLILALGVLRMARRNAIVRRLAAVETLGSTTVICADKTGTLTENRISVTEFRPAGGMTVTVEEGSPGNSEIVRRLVRVAVLCNEASFDPDAPKGEAATGDPTETALLEAAVTLGYDVSGIRAEMALVEEIPFDPASKRMTNSWRDEKGGLWAALKGAPAVVVDNCDRYLGEGGDAVLLTEEKREEFLEANRALADRALRVLALADKLPETAETKELSDGFVFLGYAAMSDPLRPEARESVAAARRAGVRVVMLTGDQLKTAKAIAKELELGRDGDLNAVHASDLNAEGRTINEAVTTASVFARVSPEEKLKIVRALQAAGQVVAVTGDGINDAPALKQADIGVAMGARGTEVAKEAADIVLTDDNFATIVMAIESGRTIYANIRKFVHMMFSHNLAEVLLIFIAIVAALPLPLLPLQILWVNIVTDVFPAIALAVEPPSENTMNRPPRDPGSSMLPRGFLILIAWQGLVLSLIALGAYYWALENYGEGERARTMAMLALVGVQLGHFFNCRSRIRSAFSRFFSNPWIFAAAAAVVLLQFSAIYWPPLAAVLGLERPDARGFIVVAAATVLPVLIVELTKLYTRRVTRE